jgi:hypothetical protein
MTSLTKESRADLIEVLRLYAEGSPGMKRALLQAVSEIEGLSDELTQTKRKLGCQIGDSSCAPEGWRCVGLTLWRRDLPGGCMVHVLAIRNGTWIWSFYDEHDVSVSGDIYKSLPTAYEAMVEFDASYLSGDVP